MFNRYRYRYLLTTVNHGQLNISSEDVKNVNKKELTAKDDAVSVRTTHNPHGLRRHVQGQGGLKIT